MRRLLAVVVAALAFPGGAFAHASLTSTTPSTQSRVEAPPRAVVLDAGTQDELDVTSTEMVKGLVKQLREGGLQVYFADVHAPILDRGRQTGLLEAIGEDHVFPTVDAAVRHVEAET